MTRTAGQVSNPFVGYGRIVDGDRLVGRGDDVEELAHWLLETDGSFNLIGMPRVGKSSMIQAVLNRVRGRRPEVVVLYSTLEQYPAPRFFYEDLLRRLNRELSSLGVETIAPEPKPSHGPEWHDYDAFRDFHAALEAAVRLHPDFRLIVCIDDFDRVCSWEQGPEVIRQIRSLANDAATYHVSFALVSKRRLRVIEVILTGVSTLADMCHVHFLKPLSKDDLRQMLTRGSNGAGVSAADEDLLAARTGGHPFLAEMCLYHACQTGSIALGIQRAVTQTMEFYGLLKRLLDNDMMFLHLMRTAVRPRLKLPDGAFPSLHDYGLVRDTAGSDPGPVGWSEHFQLYLERCRREAEERDEMWVVWRRTEMAVRDFIESRLRDAIGSEWESTIAGRHESVARMFDACRQRAEDESRNFRLPEIGRLLDYAYPDGLWLILTKEWSNFQPHLAPRPKPEYQRLFETMGRVRNPVAHNRPVPEAEERAAKDACQRVLDALNDESLSTVES